MSNRTTALLVLAAIVAAAVTVEVTYFVLDRFVLHDPNDPLTKAADYRRTRRRRGNNSIEKEHAFRKQRPPQSAASCNSGEARTWARAPRCHRLSRLACAAIRCRLRFPDRSAPALHPLADLRFDLTHRMGGEKYQHDQDACTSSPR
jgi:hypothetical protein